MFCCRPVDCATGSKLNYNPGFVNSTIYSDHMEAGWGFHPWISRQPKVVSSFLEVQGAGVNSSNATCVTLQPEVNTVQKLVETSRSTWRNGFKLLLAAF